MVNQQLVKYIKSNLQKGYPLQQIKQSLLAQGWSDYDINEAVNLTQGEPKSSKKILIFSVLFAVIIISSIFAFFMFNKSETTQQSETEITYEDCGASDSCFSNYAKTCTPAKATISDQGLTYVETTEGFNGNNCLLTLVYTESPVAGFIGKEMNCKVPKSNLVNFKDYLQGERMKQSCEGPLIDFLIAQETTS